MVCFAAPSPKVAKSCWAVCGDWAPCTRYDGCTAERRADGLGFLQIAGISHVPIRVPTTYGPTDVLPIHAHPRVFLTARRGPGRQAERGREGGQGYITGGG